MKWNHILRLRIVCFCATTLCCTYLIFASSSFLEPFPWVRAVGFGVVENGNLQHAANTRGNLSRKGTLGIFFFPFFSSIVLKVLMSFLERRRIQDGRSMLLEGGSWMREWGIGGVISHLCRAYDARKCCLKGRSRSGKVWTANILQHYSTWQQDGVVFTLYWKAMIRSSFRFWCLKSSKDY